MDTYNTKTEPVVGTIDWLTLRLKTTNIPDNKTLNTIVASLLPGTTCEDWQRVNPLHDKKLSGFHCRHALRKHGIAVLYGNNDDYVYAVMSGNAVRSLVSYNKAFKSFGRKEVVSRLISFLRRNNWQFRMIHVAFDDRAGLLPLDLILAKGESVGPNQGPTEFRGSLRTFEPRTRNGNGRYLKRGGVFGSWDHGSSVVSIYDKQLEQGDPEFEVATRVELRCRDGGAENLATLLETVGIVAAKEELVRCLQFVEPIRARTNSKKRSKKHPQYLPEKQWPVCEWWKEFTSNVQPGNYLGRSSKGKRSALENLNRWDSLVTAVLDGPSGLNNLETIVLSGRHKMYGAHRDSLDDEWKDVRGRRRFLPSAIDQAAALATVFPVALLIVAELATKDLGKLEQVLQDCRARSEARGVGLRWLFDSLQVYGPTADEFE